MKFESVKQEHLYKRIMDTPDGGSAIIADTDLPVLKSIVELIANEIKIKEMGSSKIMASMVLRVLTRPFGSHLYFEGVESKELYKLFKFMNEPTPALEKLTSDEKIAILKRQNIILTANLEGEMAKSHSFTMALEDKGVRV